MTISAYSAAVASGRQPLPLDQRARPQRAGRLLDDFGVQFLPADRAAVVARGDARQTNAVGEKSGVVEGRAAGDDRVGVLDELFDELGRTRRRGDHRLRLVAEPQAQHRLIERVGIAPGGEFVQPQLHVLLAAQPVRLLGRENLATAPLGHASRVGGARVMRPLVAAGRSPARPDSPSTMMSRTSCRVAPIRLTIG